MGSQKVECLPLPAYAGANDHSETSTENSQKVYRFDRQESWTTADIRSGQLKRKPQPLSRSRLTKSGRLDLNQRPFDPQSNALPDCATARVFWKLDSKELSLASVASIGSYFVDVSSNNAKSPNHDADGGVLGAIVSILSLPYRRSRKVSLAPISTGERIPNFGNNSSATRYDSSKWG